MDIAFVCFQDVDVWVHIYFTGSLLIVILFYLAPATAGSFGSPKIQFKGEPGN